MIRGMILMIAIVCGLWFLVLAYGFITQIALHVGFPVDDAQTIYWMTLIITIVKAIDDNFFRD